jgi:pimeloyl-ACP methyl ester carboxylesterase
MPGPYTFERVVSLLAAWMDANRIGSASLVGHSMGGQVAMLFAAEYPDRAKSMVLLAPAGLPFSGNLIGIGRQAFLSRAGGDRRFTPIVTFGALRAGPRILWQAVQQIRQVDVRPHLIGLTVPTLILWGERDRLIPIANAPILSAAMPHAEIRTLPGMGHNIFFDDAKMVNEAILAFIDRFNVAGS